MFGSNFFKKGLPNPFEDLSDRPYVLVRVSDSVDSNGDFTPNFSTELCHTNVPQTPQSGIECKVDDLAFAIRNNLEVSRSLSRLSLFDTRNPFESARIVKNIGDSLYNK